MKIIHKIKNCQRGFSLIEVMVVAVIVAVLFSCFATFFLIGFRLWETGEIRVELQQELRNALIWITNDLRQAGSSSASIIDVPADGTPYPAITFRVCNGVSAGRISWSSNTIHYGINANQLLRTEAGANIAISQNIQSLYFRRQAATPHIVEVGLGLAMSSRSSLLSESLNFAVRLRN